jgi:hypothetical protein
MALGDVLATLQADKKEKKTAEKRYVSFTAAEWGEMEAAYGKKIDPADVKKLVQGIFKGVFSVNKR